MRLREEAIRSLARRPPPEEQQAPAPSLRAFVKDRKLTAIPTSHSKRLQILDLIAQDFEIGVRYSERRVKDILLRWHPDYAALRRHLVDDGFLERQGGGGHYWRSGGTVDV